MWTSLAVFLIAAVLCAGVALWVLLAYRRAGGGARSGRSAILMCAAVALAGLMIYLSIGRPELPDAPYQQRLNALVAELQRPNPRPFTLDERLALWTHIARNTPRDPIPHLQVGDLLLRAGRFREAAVEFEQALRIRPTSAEAALGLGRALVAAEGRITQAALRYFEQAGQLGDDPAPLMYQARAAMESGRDADARRFWGEAARRMQPSDPMHEMAARMSRGEQP